MKISTKFYLAIGHILVKFAELNVAEFKFSQFAISEIAKFKF